jgi:tetratricopeptide (TPR) repeat protein
VVAVALATTVVRAANPDAQIPPAARNSFDKASIAREEGRVQDACQLYRQAIEAHPLYWDAHASYLDCLRSLGQLSAARDVYAGLVEKHGGSFLLKVFQAASLEPDQARTALQALSAEKPGDARALTELGRVALLGDDPRAAEKHLKQAVRSDPNLVVAHLLLGDAALRVRRWPTARKSYQAALEIDPSSAPAHLRVAVSWHRQGKSDKALEILRNLLSEDNLPRLVAGHWTLVVIHAELEQYKQALGSVDRILAIRKEDLRAHIAKGNLLLLEGDAAAAVKVLAAAAEKNPRSAAALFALGWAYEKAADAPEIDDATKRDRLTMSAEAYEKCTRLDPTVRPRDSLGFVQLLRQDKQAEANFKQARDIDPKFAPAVNNLGLWADIADDRAEAMKRYNIVLKQIDKQNVRALVSIALDHWLQGSRVKAIQFLEQALKIDSEDDLAWTFLGDVHWDKGNKSGFRAAVRCYRRAVAINDKNFIAWSRGEARRSAHRPDLPARADQRGRPPQQAGGRAALLQAVRGHGRDRGLGAGPHQGPRRAARGQVGPARCPLPALAQSRRGLQTPDRRRRRRCGRRRAGSVRPPPGTGAHRPPLAVKGDGRPSLAGGMP